MSLAKGYAEVESRSKVMQEKQKAYYDKNRREADPFLPGDHVLVYKPTRKVGLAAKLLHCYHGPYLVVKQTTPLNYELKNLKNLIFKLEGERAFSDSEWVVVTEVTFDQPDVVIQSLFTWLNLKSKLPMN